MTAPGMAYFGGTGPVGKRCGDCKFKGFSYPGPDRISAKTGDVVNSLLHSNGCAKTYEMTGRKKPGPEFPNNMHACKYFIQKIG